MDALIIEANREAYSIYDIHKTMTVGELKDYLEQFEEDLPVYLSHDNGYTYGGIRENMFEEKESDEYQS